MQLGQRMSVFDEFDGDAQHTVDTVGEKISILNEASNSRDRYFQKFRYFREGVRVDLSVLLLSHNTRVP